MTTVQLDRPMLQSQANATSSARSLRILFLAPFAPRLQASHGGGRVIAQLIAHLAQRHSIGLCYLRAPEEPAIDDVLREHCDVVEEVLLQERGGAYKNRWPHRLQVWKELMMGKPLWAIDRLSPAYSERVNMLLKHWRPDILQVEFHIMGQYLSALSEYPAPRILVQHEPGADSAREFMNSPLTPGRIMPWLDLFAWKRFERKVMRQVQAVVVFTERDRESIGRLGADIPVVRIPIGTEIPEPTSSGSQDSLSLLFVGNFKHLPNVDAADRLINNIFPPVRSQVPAARLVIVGDHLPSHLLNRSIENTILTGYVPEIKPYLDEATLVVVPLRLGGGMRVKVLEALAAGKVVVASPRAVEGLDLVDGKQVILAESDDEFSRAITDLLNHPSKRDILATQARAWAQANLSWDKTVLAYETLYRQLLQGLGSRQSSDA